MSKFGVLLLLENMIVEKPKKINIIAKSEYFSLPSESKGWYLIRTKGLIPNLFCFWNEQSLSNDTESYNVMLILIVSEFVMVWAT